ncbi:MAG: hypothetical protein IIA92_11440 [Chloroflexi bacterium]|nr:hypothetical protein [Chloroflexota bacterium]
MALETLKNQSTMSELASRYPVHPSQITRRKQQLEDGVEDFFCDVKEIRARDGEE